MVLCFYQPNSDLSTQLLVLCFYQPNSDLSTQLLTAALVRLPGTMWGVHGRPIQQGDTVSFRYEG